MSVPTNTKVIASRIMRKEVGFKELLLILLSIQVATWILRTLTTVHIKSVQQRNETFERIAINQYFMIMRNEYLESRLTGVKMKFGIKSDNVMSDILAKEPADDLTIEEAHELYEKAMYFSKHRFDKPLTEKDLLPKR